MTLPRLVLNDFILLGFLSLIIPSLGEVDAWWKHLIYGVFTVLLLALVVLGLMLTWSA